MGHKGIFIPVEIIAPRFRAKGVHGNDAVGRFVEYVQNGVFSGGEREGLTLAVYFCLVEIDGAMGQLDHCFLIFV